MLEHNRKQDGDFNPIPKQMATAPKPHYQHATSSLAG